MLCWHVAIVWPGLRAAYFVFYVASVVKELHGIIVRIAIRVLLITFKKRFHYSFSILITRLCLMNWYEILTEELSSSDHKSYAAL